MIKISENRRNINGNYVTIPRFIIEDIGLDNLRVVLFCYLARNRSLQDTVNMSLNNLVFHCKYKPNIRTGEINSRLICLLDGFESIDIFDKIYGEYSNDKLCTLRLNKDPFERQNNFAYITLKEIDILFNYELNLRTVSFEKLILVLSYIRVNIPRRGKTQREKPQDKPECYYRQIKTISEELNFKPKLISTCIDILEKLNIIVTEPMGRYKDSGGNWHTDVTLFVDKIDDWKQELEWRKEFLIAGKKEKFKQGEFRDTS